MRLVLATKNPGKIREIRRICRDWAVEWVEGTWPDVEETGVTYLENALLKARAVCRHLGVPAVADDSGIEADALGGAPGVYSAMFAGEGASDGANLDLLLRRVAESPGAPRTARYRCVAVCVRPDGREVWTEGSCEGVLITEPRGTGGFGYDPAFVPAGQERTMAELGPQEKDRISHRGRAFRELGRLLRHGAGAPGS